MTLLCSKILYWNIEFCSLTSFSYQFCWKSPRQDIYFYAKEQLLLAPLKYLTSGEVSSVNFYFVKTPSKEEWRTLISDLKKPSNSLHEYLISATDWRTDIFRNRITWTFIAETTFPADWHLKKIFCHGLLSQRLFCANNLFYLAQQLKVLYQKLNNFSSKFFQKNGSIKFSLSKVYVILTYIHIYII